MFNLDWLKPPAPAPNSESLLQENETLKKQLKELLTLDETGFFIELDSLLNAILKKALILCKAESSFIALTGKDPSELDVRVSNLILEEKMIKIRENYKKEYARWKETESDILTIDDFILLPLVRRHKILGVVGLKLNSDAPDNVCEILPVLGYKAAASLESAILYDRMFKRLLVLSNVFIFGREIIANLDLQTLVDKFLSTAIDGTDSEIASIYLFRDKLEYPYFSRVFSKEDPNIIFSVESVTGYTDLIKLVRNEGQPKTINSFENSEFYSEINKIQGIKIKDSVVIPLKPRETMLGVIQVCNKKGNSSYSYEDMDLLKILGSQIAFVIQNAELFNNLEKAYLDTLSALTNAIDAKDSYTRGHSDRVTELSVRLAKEAKVENTDLEKIRLGGMLHDIGKIGIPENILNKPGRLDDHEFEVIKSHPVMGVSILGGVEFLQNVVPIIKHHHERYDGNGYPDKLKGGDIPFLARIVSIADTYDAMTTNRPYRKALTIEESLKEIERCKGTQFDPELADLFVKMIQSDGH
jgi:putative nucleotidyltransferase with HDIG domain